MGREMMLYQKIQLSHFGRLLLNYYIRYEELLYP